MAFQYIFGAKTGETPDTLARKQEIRDAIAAQMLGNTPTTALGGIGALLSGAAVGYGRYRDSKAVDAGQSKANDLFSSILGGTTPGANPDASTSTLPGNNTLPMVPGTMENAHREDRLSVPGYSSDSRPQANLNGNDVFNGFMGTVKGQISNPYALSAIAATGKHESAFSPGNANRAWDDGANMAGGIMSWNGPRLQNMYKYAAAKGERPGAISPQTQAEFFLGENPQLTAALQNAKSVEEAQQLMNNAWAFKGYNQPGNGEAKGRLRDAGAFLPQFQNGAQPKDAQSAMSAMMADPRGQPGQQTQQPVQVADNSNQMPAQQMQAQQPANPLAGVDPKLLQAMANPWLSAEQKSVIQTMVKQQMENADPMHGLEMRKATAEVNALEHPATDWKIVNGKDGSVFRVDPQTGRKDILYGPQEDDAIRGLKQRAAAAGLKEGTPEWQQFMASNGTPTAKQADIQKYEYDKQQGYAGSFHDWMIENNRTSASSVNIDQKAESQFDKTVAEKQAASFNAMADEGMNARSDLAVINQLDGLMKGQGGAITGLSSMVSKWGVPFEGGDDLQAANALINKLVPSQRTPGSGTMSDGDVALFRASLPNLWNQPGGNQKIIDTMRGLAKYKQDQGEIADQVMTGEITRQEGRRALRALPNPLAGFDKDTKLVPGDANAGNKPGNNDKKAGQNGVPEGIDPSIWNVMTPEEKKLWQN